MRGSGGGSGGWWVMGRVTDRVMDNYKQTATTITRPPKRSKPFLNSFFIRIHQNDKQTSTTQEDGNGAPATHQILQFGIFWFAAGNPGRIVNGLTGWLWKWNCQLPPVFNDSTICAKQFQHYWFRFGSRKWTWDAPKDPPRWSGTYG